MSFHRFVYLCGWTAVALLAIVGFAAFSADSTPPTLINAPQQPSWGVAAGAVSGQGWLALAGNQGTASVVTAASEETIGTTVNAADPTPPVTIDTGWLDSVAVRELVQTYFASGDVNQAVRLAWCVSRFDIDAISPSTGASGLFQIDPATWDDLASDAGLPATADIFDPEMSTAVAAYIVYQGDSWGYWDCQG
ncbi:MAG: transglycosylase SLT domain-containing protein [Acidimicrobiia bacterium]|nr:transglycosylase SLT domain-containing protein [Acidimicrobiia bacterium]